MMWCGVGRCVVSRSVVSRCVVGVDMMWNVCKVRLGQVRSMWVGSVLMRFDGRIR